MVFLDGACAKLSHLKPSLSFAFNQFPCVSGVECTPGTALGFSASVALPVPSSMRQAHGKEMQVCSAYFLVKSQAGP